MVEYQRIGTQVSTHSRLKAAGPQKVVWFSARNGFNTQPPKGGWPLYNMTWQDIWFQHTAA